MNLALDIGNTRIKGGIFQDGRLDETHTWKELKEVESFIKDKNPTNIICSTVREDAFQWQQLGALVLNHTTSIPIENNYDTPETLGMDRLAAVIGAWNEYPQIPLLVIDAGTCITYDFIDSSGVYQGGAISPGVQMKYKALNNFTKSLPLLDGFEAEKITGKTTAESILSGVLIGTAAEMEGFIRNYQKEHKSLKTIFTGGDAEHFESKIKATIFVDQNLVLKGLNRILEHNEN